MSTPLARSKGQQYLDLSQDSLFDDDEVDDPASPSPAKQQQRKRRKQSAEPRNSSSGSAGSAQRAGRGGGGTGWHAPLGGNAGKTAHARRKGKSPSPSAAANTGGSSLSGKSVAIIYYVHRSSLALSCSFLLFM